MNKPSTLPFIVSVAVVIGFLLGQGLNSGKLQTQNNDDAFGSKLDGILEIIDNNYVDTIDRQAFVENAIDDILQKLDPHSAYIPASQMKAMQEGIEGKFGGVGIRFSIMRDTLCVTHVVKGSPSEKAGVLSGDRIIAIDDIPLGKDNLNNTFVMEHLKGTPQTDVRINLIRKGKKISTKITRGIIDVESITAAFMLNNTVGYIRLEQFSLKSAEEFRNAALQLKSQGMKKLVFDLRDNGGGVLGSAIEIVDEFLEKNKLIVYTQGAHKKERRYNSSSKGILKEIPVVILINQNSASASEIVAGALQDNDRATIIGRRSFGKGLVQEDISLKDQSNVRLTVARYYTPTGRSIQRPYGEDIDYNADFMERYDKGELYQVDSTLFVDSLKFTTPKGRVVYGGGGIMPDIFNPQDSSGFTFYFTELRYTGAFSQFSFFKWDKLGRSQYKSLDDFMARFQISKKMLDELVVFAEKNLKIKRNDEQIARSQKLIERYLKAEFARQIWIEQGFFKVLAKDDSDVKRALQFFIQGK
jgi:carboxyl-terminal processing protease